MYLGIDSDDVDKSALRPCAISHPAAKQKSITFVSSPTAAETCEEISRQARLARWRKNGGQRHLHTRVARSRLSDKCTTTS